MGSNAINLSELSIRDFEIFCLVVDAGGFREASKRLNLAPSQVSRRLQYIEACLGGRVLERTTRTMKLTQLGRKFLAEARQLAHYSDYLSHTLSERERWYEIDTDSLRSRAHALGICFRDQSLVSLAKLIANIELRWLSITGMGGVGKTLTLRLLNAELGSKRAQLVTWCDWSHCADIGSALMYLSARLGVARAAQSSIEDDLCKHLRLRPQLLLLDNLEQLAGAKDAIDRLIERCRHVRVVTTSRTTLGSRYEIEHRLATFAIPPNTTRTLSQVRKYPSFRFFENALSRKMGSEECARQWLAEQGLARCIDAVRYTAGIPLAIELLAGYFAQISLKHGLEMLSSAHLPDELYAVESTRYRRESRHDSVHACFLGS
ncbi:MAG: LysR family transcriptional regulator [Casimicrobium sp.]